MIYDSSEITLEQAAHRDIQLRFDFNGTMQSLWCPDTRVTGGKKIWYVQKTPTTCPDDYANEVLISKVRIGYWHT